MRGELEFEGALRERVGMLKGLPLTRCSRPTTSACASIPARGPGAHHGAQRRALRAGLRRLHLLHEPRGEAAGFHATAPTPCERRRALSGKVGEPILGARPSSPRCRRRPRASASARETLAIGDGANDLAMIEAAGLGVAYRAKPWSPPRPTPRSTTPTSPRCSTSRATAPTSS
jgi:phosphoserine phosphatase